MPITLSIKNVPDELAERLRRRATRHHRSLQGEFLAILEESLADQDSLSPQHVLERVRRLDLHTSEEAVSMIRQDRNER